VRRATQKALGRCNNTQKSKTVKEVYPTIHTGFYIIRFFSHTNRTKSGELDFPPSLEYLTKIIDYYKNFFYLTVQNYVAIQLQKVVDGDRKIIEKKIVERSNEC